MLNNQLHSYVIAGSDPQSLHHHGV